MSSQKSDTRIREAADKALAAVPAEHMAEARVTRQKLYAWLSNMARLTNDPSQAVAKSLEDSVREEYGLPEAATHQVIAKILSGTWTGGSLVSRMEGEGAWVPTSFFYDPDTLALNVKVGQNPYQPIAFDNGDILVQLETAKLLWARFWAIALAAPLAAPFDVINNVVRREDFVAHVSFLSENDLKGIDKAFAELGEELDSYLKVDTEDKDAFKEAEFRLRETLKLARIWAPVVDAKLKQVVRGKAALGQDFQNAPIVEVVRATLEFMAFRKDSYLAMMKQASTELRLSPLTAEVRQALANECLLLGRLLTGEVIVVEVLTNLLGRIFAAAPFDADTLSALEKEPDVISRATAVYNLLAPRLAVDTASAGSASSSDANSGGTGDGVQAAACGKDHSDGSAPSSDAAGALPVPNASAIDGANPHGPQG